MKTIAYSAGYLKWYSHYPIHLGKADGFKAWQQEECEDEVDMLCDAVDAQKERDMRLMASNDRRADAGQEPIFIRSWKYPAGWLRGHRWEDDAT